MDYTHMANHAHELTFEQLDAAMPAIVELKKTLDYLTTAHAYHADKTHAGDTIGSPHTADYIAHTHHITRQAATKKITQGHALFGTVRKDHTHAQQHLRHMVRTGELTLTTLDAINTTCQAIKRADKKAPLPLLRLDMAKNTAHRTPTDAKKYLKQLLPKQRPNHTKCGAWWSNQDTHGLYTLTLKVTPGDKHRIDATLLREEKTLRTALRNKRITLTPPQVLYRAAKKALTGTTTGGTALVISVTAKELNQPHPIFFTNQATTLDAEDTLELIDDADTWIALHDPVTFQALALGRTSRIASIEQRIALHAEQGVCAAPNCNAASAACQAHHLTPWAQGGETNIDNLALLCPLHHAHNADAGPTRKRGQYKRDPDGTIRHHFRGEARENHSTMSAYSSRRKLRPKE